MRTFVVINKMFFVGFYQAVVETMSPEEVKQVLTDSYNSNGECHELEYDFLKGRGFELAMGGNKH
jgi:hypothetical protein